MSIILKSGSSSDLASINANKELQVALTSTPANAGYTRLCDEYGDPQKFDYEGRVQNSNDVLAFYDDISGTAVDYRIWTTSVTTMAISQASGAIVLNSAGITTASTSAQIQSLNFFTNFRESSNYLTMSLKPEGVPESNATCEVGFGTASGTSSPTDGVFFRWNSSGEFRCVINFGGSESMSPALPAPAQGMFSSFEIVWNSLQVIFNYIDNTSTEQRYVFSVPPANPMMTAVSRQPVFARVYTGGTPPSSVPKLSLGEVCVNRKLLQFSDTWHDQLLTSMDRGSHQNVLTPFDQTCNWGNSAAPASATLSNTTAGYTTLGGRFGFAPVAGTATDYALFAYQIPAGFRLFVEGINVTAYNTTGASPATNCILDWGLGLNANAVSLATADSFPGTVGTRRIPLGSMSLPTGSAAGIMFANPINIQFNTSLIINPGRYLHVILRIPSSGTGGTSVIQGVVGINGFFY